MVEKVISGGQTGVDRAALDAALVAGMACGGWCPRGRRAEDGPIPDIYPLKETRRAAYRDRTRLNVEESDGTLIVTRGRPTGGTRRTVEHADRVGKPVLVLDLDEAGDDGDGTAAQVRDWVLANRIGVMNVAGPRESTQPGIYAAATALLLPLFAAFREAR